MTHFSSFELIPGLFFCTNNNCEKVIFNLVKKKLDRLNTLPACHTYTVLPIKETAILQYVQLEYS